MANAIRPRLWEVKHPYYCNEGNYYARGTITRHDRWQDFIDDMGDADMDLNLLFRWDWESPHEDDDPQKPINWQGDENYRDCTLKLFFMGQRKGAYFCCIVHVCRADEPNVYEYLRVRGEHLLKLWSPVMEAPRG